ncbi:MAG: hypothetical protein FWC36_01810 [Spirochaetes bacterium]|nr:hypothetical protein [Spirochaetota bacterium]
MSEPLTSSLKLRQRSSWEAADSGVLLWRNNLVFFLILMVLPFIVTAIFLRLLPLPVWWSYIIIWWLKPLFARPVLHVISVRFFKPQAAFSEISKGLGKSLFTALAGDLLWRRFSLWRSARMPIRTLEQLSGKAAEARIATLETGGLNFCSALTTVTTAVFFTVLAGKFLFAAIILELSQTMPLSSVWQYTEAIELFAYIMVCLILIIIEPLYVCMGFGIYINSRIEVEGWDIQLLLQNFVKQKTQKSMFFRSKLRDAAVPSASRIMLSSVMVIGLFLLFASLNPKSVQAEQLRPENVPIEVLEQVLSSPDFGGKQDGWGIRLKNPRDPKEPPDINFAWLEKIRDFFGFFLLLILVLVIVSAIVYLIFRLYKLKMNNVRGKEKNWKSSLATSIGQAANQAPETLLEEARFLHNQGMIRDAWAKCFIAAVIIYSSQDNLEFPVDATEYECLFIVKKAKARNAEGFAYLVLSWTSLAYGGNIPTSDMFEKAIAFCISLNQDPTAAVCTRRGCNA